MNTESLNTESLPQMSVVVVTPDNYATVRKTIRHLRAQKAKDRLEIVLVAPEAKGLGVVEAEMREFKSFRVVECGTLVSTARARALGVRRASAPVVALVEDHAFPAPGWAEALIAAHERDYAAVGPLMANANPHSLVSWVNLLIEYSEWLEPRAGGEVEHLPGHNDSYKRDVLLQYGARLEAMLDAESILHWDLRARGHKLYLEPKARTFHQNFSLPLPTVPLRFNGGRLFAASRARGWSFTRRAFYACAAPLIPLVRLSRIVRALRQPGRPRQLLPRILPALLAALVVDAFGEMCGYASGAGDAMAILSDMEFHRLRYLAPGERQAEA